MIYLPDVNFWIALAAERHVHHGVASQWFSNRKGDTLVFCRITQLGLLRLVTNKHVMQEDVMNPEGAWQAYRALRSDGRVGYAAEPDGLAETWPAFTEGSSTSPNIWTDAYLSAFASAARYTFVTFDAKMPIRDGVICVRL